MTPDPPAHDAARTEMFQRIRQALGRTGETNETPTPPTIDRALIRVNSEQPDLSSRFEQNAEAVGMICQRICQNELVDQTVTTLQHWNANTLTLSMKDNSTLASALCQAGFTLLDNPTLDAQFDADAGITDVDAGLAESGSLAITSSNHRTRGASLVVPHHLAVLRRSNLYADLVDYLADCSPDHPSHLPSSTTLITGPSKTTDIEGELITGVHGPKDVHILLVEDA